MGGVLAGFGAGRDAQLQRRLTPCVYDEQPRLPVGLAVGAGDQAPRVCDSARGLTGKERAISRFVAPGPRVRIHLPPAESHTNLVVATDVGFAAEEEVRVTQFGMAEGELDA